MYSNIQQQQNAKSQLLLHQPNTCNIYVKDHVINIKRVLTNQEEEESNTKGI